ncbi:MAG: redoxin domain-containing protein [Pseudomonadota bacterium]
MGFATSAYSLFLAGVSYFQIGVGCLWCMGLYAINFSTLVIAFYIFRQAPPRPFSSPWGPLLRITLSSFVFLSILSLGTQQIYRSLLKKQWSTQDRWKEKNFNLSVSFQKPVFTAGKKVELEPMNLQPFMGKGKPLALIYRYPGFRQSDEFLPKILSDLNEKAPDAQVFTVIPLRNETRLESLIEDHRSHPAFNQIPLLFDKDSENARALGLPANQAVLILLDKDGSLSSDFPIEEFMIGKCAPSLSLSNLSTGRLFNFKPSSLKKPTLLVFWRSTCGHCRKEIPKIVEYYRTRKSELDIVSISRGVPKATMDYAKSVGVAWPVLVDSGIASYLYRVDSTPTSILISPSGGIEKYWRGSVAELETTFDSALREVASSPRSACETTELPQKAKLDFSVQRADGSQALVESLISKPTLVHFWATWCLPCQEELPHFLKYAQSQKSKGIDSLLVTVESVQEKDKVSQFLKPYAMTGPVYFSPSGGIYDSLNSAYSVPRTYLVNSKSEVLKKYLGAQDWQNENFQELVTTWYQNEY